MLHIIRIVFRFKCNDVILMPLDCLVRKYLPILSALGLESPVPVRLVITSKWEKFP